MLNTLERQSAGTHFPALKPEHLGDESFRRDHRLRYAYVAGAMANGIASTRLVGEMAGAGMLSFFGAAGLSLERIGAAIDELARTHPGAPYGFNLIHSPNEPDHEAGVVDLYLRRGVRLVEASAYLRLTLPVVRYRVNGIKRDAGGRVVTPNRIVAKVSRVEVATQFFSPPPQEYLDELVRQGEITPEQSLLAALVPMAQDLTAEADSGGHTDNRPLVTLLPTLIALRDRLQEQFGYEQRLRVGAAGGLSTPAGLAAAFAMGAAYVLTGSVNQACIESGSSDAACWHRPSRRISPWRRPRTCSKWGCGSRCSSAARCSQCARPSCMICTGRMRAWKPCRKRIRHSLKSNFFVPRSTRAGAGRGSIFWRAIR